MIDYHDAESVEGAKGMKKEVRKHHSIFDLDNMDLFVWGMMMSNLNK